MVDDPNKLSENDSFMDEDDFLAADREEGESGGEGRKANLKEIWAQNPSLKIFAIVAFIGVFLLGYLAFGGDGDKPQDPSTVHKTAEVSQPPGTAELPPAYEEAVRESNEQSAANAEQTGGSSIPTMIQRPSERIEAPVQVEETDPLSAWRREAESRRLERQQESENAPSTANLLPAATQPTVTPPDVSTSASSTGNMGALNATQAAQAPPPLPTGQTPEMVLNMATQLQQQMATVMDTQVPKESIVVSMNIQPAFDPKKYATPAPDAANGANATNASATNNGAATSIVSPPAKPLISAGTIVYAQILTEANSDVPGPVLAEVASGPLTGGRAIGEFQVAQRHLVLQFRRVVKNGVEYAVQGIALDPGTTLPGVATDINYHLFSRVFLPAAASFIQGFAQAATQQDTDTIVTNGTVITNNTQDLDTREELLQGLNQGAQGLSQFIDQMSDRPVTIRVAGGTRIGILFINAVYDPSTAQGQQALYPNQAQTAGLQNVYGGQQQQQQSRGTANTATNAAFSTASSFLNGANSNTNGTNSGGFYNNTGSSTIYSGRNTGTRR